jgi:hypothetical protein
MHALTRMYTYPYEYNTYNIFDINQTLKELAALMLHKSTNLRIDFL